MVLNGNDKVKGGDFDHIMVFHALPASANPAIQVPGRGENMDLFIRNISLSLMICTLGTL